MKNKWQHIPIIVIVILVLTEFFWYLPSTHPQDAEIKLQTAVIDGLTCNIEYTIETRLPLDAQVIAVPVQGQPLEVPICVYYDENYSTVGTSWTLSRMLWEHVKTQSLLSEYQGDIALVEAADLKIIFQEKKECIVIFASGKFPENIFSLEENLVKPWIEAGGILIWFGAAPGYYSVNDSGDILKENGVALLGINSFYDFSDDNTQVFADIKSDLPDVLNLSFNYVQSSPVLNRVLAANGKAIGKVGGDGDNKRSAVSLIPFGQGQIIIFGGYLSGSYMANGPEFSAVDVTHIINSGILQVDSSAHIESRIYYLDKNDALDDELIVSMSTETTGIILYAYQTKNSSALLFYKEFIKI